MKRKMCLVLAGLMVAGLAGCGADQKGSSADGNEEMEIVYAHFQGEGDAQYKSIQNAITAFEKDNPGLPLKRSIILRMHICCRQKLGVRQGNCRTFAW